MVSAVDYTVRESGLQQDLPPAVGNISSLLVFILKNDNAEGILEFRQDYVRITGKSQKEVKKLCSDSISRSAVC